ncbi:hypothetical protein [Acidovorax sp. SUPP3334]|uniref:hypothetical protein n=1 Tax=Acidovorax sp. SUPP3334 TaxID=2920881 RepID=UPI0023DE55B2|nr:hypothetical protein [Acidovorax sp. SUPP3334]GKT25359.1 hypothetical protein AVHM3334_17685 [Acidovorax sp. SUPP3334]
MSAAMQAFQAGWTNQPAATLTAALPRSIGFGDIPTLPLARAIDMPAQAGFMRGSLGIDLSGMQLALAGDVPLAVECSSDSQGRCVLAVRLQNIELQGIHTLKGTQIWETGLDGAGTAMPIGARRRGGSADDNAHPTWIQTANCQRESLQNLPGTNGPTLLSTYSNHRAAFNDVFNENNFQAYAFQQGWGNSAVSEMAGDTNTALTEGGVVNDPVKTYYNSSTGITTNYNGHAQNQKLALLTTLTAMAEGADPNNPKDATNPYNQAAAATLGFGTSIVQNTNVTQITDVPAQTKDSVYGLVQTGTPATPPSVEDVHNFLNGSPIGGRDAQGNSWTWSLSEDERAFVRKLQADIAEHTARVAAQKPMALVKGALRARLACHVYLQFGGQGADGAPALIDGRVELDGFDLHFDDDAWNGALGDSVAQTARDALSEARFIKSLVHDRIADALERALVQPLAKALLDSQP